MALAIKPPRATGEYGHVYSDDPALDKKNPSFDHERFVESGDQSFLPCHAGKEPSVFTLRHLTGAERKEILDVADRKGWHSAAWKACKIAIQSISDLEFKPEFEGGRKVVPEPTMDQLDACTDPPGALLLEVGMRVLVGDQSPKKQ